MKDVSIHLTYDIGSPQEALIQSSKEALIQLFTKEVDDFSRWLERKPPTMQQGALTKAERVLLLTYLMQKYAGNIDKE